MAGATCPSFSSPYADDGPNSSLPVNITPIHSLTNQILIVAGPCLPAHTSSDARHTQYLGQSLADSGHPTTVLTQVPAEHWDDYPADFQRVRYLPYYFPAECTNSHAAAIDQFVEWYTLLRPAALLICSNIKHAQAAVMAAQLAKLPHWLDLRTDQQTVESWMKSAQGILLQSPNYKDLDVQDWPSHAITLAPPALMAIPPIRPRNQALARRLGINRNQVIAYLGDPLEASEYDSLFRACADLIQHKPSLKLLLLTPAETSLWTEQLRKNADDLGLSKALVLLEAPTPNQRADCFGLADVIVIPQGGWLNKGLPLDGVEALAFGKPLVFPEPPDYSSKSTNPGLAYDSSNPTELKDALLLSLEETGLTEEEGQIGRNWVASERLWTRQIAPFLLQLETAGITAKTQEKIPSGVKPLRIAAIMDEFTAASYAPECDLLQLLPHCWLGQLAQNPPDLLFIESAWKGLDELWYRKVAQETQILQAIVRYCKARRIPTVFWNKEDPVHFDTFISTARLFDHVFTTDADCIPRYRKALGHHRIYPLPFACQPKLHNPIETYQRKKAICFAGSYYRYFSDRTRNLRHLLDHLTQQFHLEIFDRYYGQNDPNYQFPAEYQSFIKGNLPFDQINRAYKGYRYALNLNSVKQSPTMFARRIFELLASNTLVLSNYSRGVRLLFGNLVLSSDDGPQLLKKLKYYADDEHLAGKLRLAGLRKVLSEHTYAHRLSYIAQKALNYHVAPAVPKIQVLALARDIKEFNLLLGHCKRQTYQQVRYSVFITEGWQPPNLIDSSIEILLASNFTTANVAALCKQADFVSGFVAEDYYGPNYLNDLALSTRFTSAPLLGKGAFYENIEGVFMLQNAVLTYRPVPKLKARCSIIQPTLIGEFLLLDWLNDLPEMEYTHTEALSLDPYHYCLRASEQPWVEVSPVVDDIALDVGVDFPEFVAQSEGNYSGNITQIFGNQASYLILTNQYPHYEHIYRNQFVHARVKAYLQAGFKVDVFSLSRDKKALHYYELEDIEVMEGSDYGLKQLLETGAYQTVAVHFLDSEMWKILEQFTQSLRIIPWLHGFEVQPWHKRDYNFSHENQRYTAQREGEKRMEFWQFFLQSQAYWKLVIVSQSFADEIMDDYALTLDESRYTVIPNPVDTHLFQYFEKPAHQRRKILSIRPFASRKYANDLTVAAILLLSKQPWFKELEFNIVGDGALFEETLQPLQNFPNVLIEKRFLNHQEMADRFTQYGIFLCPTRWDSHGVSRDEAMSSGLVPITTAISAVPEFVNEGCGILAPPESAKGLAEGIIRLYESPALFAKLSRQAAARVRQQSAADLVIAREIALIRSADETNCSL